jgi:hypothetical protein
MKTNSRVSRVNKIAAAVTLGSFAAAAAADPFSLQGVCRLTSIIAGQGQCQLEVILTDDFLSPTTVRLGLVKVDGIVVAQYQNDITNPATTSAGTVSGVTFVSCGATHTVLAYIAPNPTTTYARVGALPPIKCPTAP